MNLGVSTWLWTSPFNTDSGALFTRIREMGYSHVEIPIEDPNLIDGKKIAERLHSEGLSAIACGAFGPTRDLTSQDKQLHQNCFDYLEKCFQLCNIWGCEFLAGPMYSAVGKTRLLPAVERQWEWDLAVANLQKVCRMAEDYALRIALEPLNRFESDLVNTAEDVMRLVADIGHPAAGVVLDSFHMSLEERNIKDAVRITESKLLHIQVSENYRGIPGTGQTNWTHLREGLEEINYEGVVSIESFTPNVQELAGAVCIWKPFAETQDQFAQEGFTFLNQLFNS